MFTEIVLTIILLGGALLGVARNVSRPASQERPGLFSSSTHRALPLLVAFLCLAALMVLLPLAFLSPIAQRSAFVAGGSLGALISIGALYALARKEGRK